MSKLSPIENRAAWRAYTKAFEAAKAKGADFHCAVAVGFSAAEVPPTVPILCAKCRKKGIFDEEAVRNRAG